MENSHQFFSNKDCKYYPCHNGVEELNCLFCFCPFYTREECPGNPVFKEKDGRRLKTCMNCTFPHKAENYERIMALLSKK